MEPLFDKIARHMKKLSDDWQKTPTEFSAKDIGFFLVSLFNLICCIAHFVYWMVWARHNCPRLTFFNSPNSNWISNYTATEISFVHFPRLPAQKFSVTESACLTPACSS
jgi:hypothetical protein